MKTVLGDIRRADEDFEMIAPGDRVAVGVSGGKDSLLLEFVQTATKNDAVVKLMKEEFKTIEVVRGGSVGIESISMMER